MQGLTGSHTLADRGALDHEAFDQRALPMRAKHAVETRIDIGLQANWAHDHHLFRPSIPCQLCRLQRTRSETGEAQLAQARLGHKRKWRQVSAMSAFTSKKGHGTRIGQTDIGAPPVAYVVHLLHPGRYEIEPRRRSLASSRR